MPIPPFREQESQAVLYQFGSFLDMMDALRLQAQETQDFARFAHLSKGVAAMLEERTSDIRACLQTQPSFLAANSGLYADLRFFACLAEALLATYRWSVERDQFLRFFQSADGLILNLRDVMSEMRGLSLRQDAA